MLELRPVTAIASYGTLLGVFRNIKAASWTIGRKTVHASIQCITELIHEISYALAVMKVHVLV